jgi:hypothetical protein
MNATIKLPRKVGGTEQVNLCDYGFPAGLPEIAVRIATYGLQQKRNDACAPLKDATPQALRDRVAEVDAALRAGIWSQRGTTSVTFESFLTSFFVSQARAKDKKNDKKDTTEGYAARAAAAIANPAFAALVAAKRAEWDAMQADVDEEMDI